MSDQFTNDVFLSHSAKDKAVVCPLAERLRADGVKVWFDEWMLKPGDSIESPQSKIAKIEEELERSRVLVLCISANAFGSDWAQLESGTFRFRDPQNKERRFLPLQLDDAPINDSDWFRKDDHERLQLATTNQSSTLATLRDALLPTLLSEELSAATTAST